MTEEKKPLPEASDQNAPKTDNPPATPAAPAEEKEAVEIKEKIDPRIVELVGEEKVKSAYGEQPKVEEKPAEEEEKKDAVSEGEQKADEPKEEDQEKTAEQKEAEAIAATPPETKPTRLDRRLASLYIRNLHLMGEEKIPTEEEIIADLGKYSKDEKVQAMHFHRLKNKELIGEKPTGDDLDEEDKEAIQDAERESIRQEILAEEYEKGVKKGFVQFIDEHTELLPDDPENKQKFPNKKVYDPALAQAVETLLKGGMRIDEAYATVTREIQRVKDAQAEKEKKEKSAALSGVLSGSGQVPVNEKELDWEAVENIEREDPQLYRKMLAEGKFKHLTG